MPVHYLKSETAPFEVETSRGKRKVELLWGDQVVVEGALPASGKVTARARGGSGTIDVKHLGDQSLLEVYFIDVGQGDGILIRTPDGRHLMIDGGYTRSKQPTGKNAADFVDWKFARDYGRDEIHLDAMIASHNDADHYGGLWDLLNPEAKDELDAKNIRVDAFYHAGVGWWKRLSDGKRTLGNMEKDGKTSYLTSLLGNRKNIEDAFQSNTLVPQGEWGDFLKCVLAAKPRIRNIQRLSHASAHLPGFEPAAGKAAIKVLGPVEFELNGAPALRSFGSESKNTNGNSVLLRIDYGRVRMLLTGDLNAAAQRLLLEQYTGNRMEFASDVVKACHHGSDDCSFEFLSAIAAGATVISSGDNETHAHPRPTIVAASALTGHVRMEKDSLVTPLVYSTEISRSVRLGKVTYATDGEKVIIGSDSRARVHYEEVSAGALRPKKGSRRCIGSRVAAGIVYGLVNVRTDGEKILCATLNEETDSWECQSFQSRF